MTPWRFKGVRSANIGASESFRKGALTNYFAGGGGGCGLGVGAGVDAGAAPAVAGAGAGAAAAVCGGCAAGLIQQV